MKHWTLGSTIAAAAFAGILLGSQTPAAPKLEFEVAAVKPNVSGDSGWSSDNSNGFLRITNATLKAIIGYAFNLRDFQMSGGPGWIESSRYDVTAKPESGAHERQMKQMLQSLLADRFQLQIHRGTKEGAGYVLLVAKNGPRLQTTKDPSHSSTSGGKTTLTAEGATMEELAASLSARIGLPVIDRTGLSDKFDFQLSWAPDAPAESLPPDAAPSLFTALQEQIGLRLEAQRVPFDVLVIDRVEKPVPR